MSLPFSQKPITCQYSKPDQPILSKHIFSWKSILMLSFNLRPNIRRGPLSLSFPSQNPARTSPRHHAIYVFRSSYSFWLDIIQNPPYAVFSNPLFRISSLAHIASSATSSVTLLACARLSVSETKFYTNVRRLQIIRL